MWKIQYKIFNYIDPQAPTNWWQDVPNQPTFTSNAAAQKWLDERKARAPKNAAFRIVPIL